MRIKLQSKIFGVFFLAAVVIVLFLVFSLRYFMYRHFTEFINRIDLERMSYLQSALIKEYGNAQSWQQLGSSEQRWRYMVYQALRERHSKSPVQPEAQQGAAASENANSRQNQPRRRLHIEDRLFLLDAQKNPVAGEPASPQEAILQAIRVNGQLVGWIGLRKQHPMRSPVEMAFIEQQYVIFYLLGGGILIITALVSFFLARHMLAPIRKLTQGTQALTSRHFSTRIDVRAKDELGQLAGDFNLMAETLEKYEQLRRQWMSDIAHELRTPLAVLRGEIEALQDGVRPITPERLGSLHSEILRLGKIVDDLHELSLAQSGAWTFKKQRVNPLTILVESLERFKTRLEERRINVLDRLGQQREITIIGDADRLDQLFSNLLENTVRYCDSPGALKITHLHRKNRWTLILEDSGPGVPPEAVERLFDRLFRVDRSRSREYGGSGLGLSICKSIVDAMNGEIRAAIATGGGLRIEIDFPQAPSR